MRLFSAQRVSLVIGLVVGLLLGLVYAWQIAPAEVVNTYPAIMRVDHRHNWIRMAALSYAADGNLERAQARLEGLDSGEVAETLEALIDQYVAAGRPADTLRSLTVLAQALGVHTPAMLVYLQTPPALSPTPVHTSTPAPSTPAPVPTASDSATPAPAPSGVATPTPLVASPYPIPTLELTGTLPTLELTDTLPTPTPPFLQRLQLVQQEQSCQPDSSLRVEVVVQDEDGAGVSGIELWLMWPGGADRAVTGLKPRSGEGYADFLIEADVIYTLGTSELGVPLVTHLRAEPCPAQPGQEAGLGSWRIVLAPPPPPQDAE